MINFRIFLVTIFISSILSNFCKAQVVRPGRYDSLYNILNNNPKVTDLRSIHMEDALQKYPIPLTNQEIDMKGDLGIGETILYSVFPDYATLKKRKRKYLKPLFVQEITWGLDTALNMTIWYKKDSLGTKPVLDRIWFKGTMF